MPHYFQTLPMRVLLPVLEKLNLHFVSTLLSQMLCLIVDLNPYGACLFVVVVSSTLSFSRR